MRFVFARFAACLLSASATFAQTDEAVSKCRAENDTLVRLHCYDAIQIEASAKPDAGSSPTASKPDVSFVSADLKIQGKDIAAQIYNSRIQLTPTFKNEAKKTVVAIGHHLTVMNAFGEKIIDIDDKLDIRIPPGKTERSKASYFWQDNPFLQGEPYDLLVGPVSTGSAKATMTVTKVVFSDGSVESF